MISLPLTFDLIITLTACVLLFLAPIVAGALAGAGGMGMAAAAVFLVSIRWFVSWRQRKVVPLSPVVVALWIFAAVQTFSLFWSVNRDLGLKAIGLTLAAAALAQLTSGLSAAYAGRGQWTGSAVPRLCVAAAVAASLLWESVTGIHEYLKNVQSDPSTRVFATFFNPDTTAGFFGMALPICLSCLWLDLPIVPTFLLALASFMGFITLTLTASKGGALALAIGLGVALFLQRRLWKESHSLVRWRVAAVYVTGILGALVSSRALFSRIATAGTAQANSALFRKMVWKSAFEMMIHRPLTGFGAGAFAQAYSRFAIAGPTQMAHNSYLQAGAECGVAGLVVLLAAVSLPIILSVRNGWKFVPGNGPAGNLNETAHILAAGIAGGLVASGVHNLIDFDWSIPGLWLLFWGLAGAVSGSSAGDNLALTPNTQPSPPAPLDCSWPQRPGDLEREGRKAVPIHPSILPPIHPSTLLLPTTHPRLHPALPERRTAIRGIPLLVLAGLHVLLAMALGLGAAAAYYEDAARESLGQALPAPPQIDPQAAIELASNAINLNPLDGSLRLTRGQAEIEAARSTSDSVNQRDLLGRAQDDLETAARLMPSSAAPLFPLGSLRRALGDLPAAAAIYQQAIRRDPHAMGASLALADIEVLRHHPAAAREALYRVARAEDTPFATIRGVPEAFDSHYAQAWTGLAHLDAESGQWNLSATEAEHALKDMDEYVHLGVQYVRLEAVMTMYSLRGRSEMKDLENGAYSVLKDDLHHLNQSSRLPQIENRHNQFLATLDHLKDPT